MRAGGRRRGPRAGRWAGQHLPGRRRRPNRPGDPAHASPRDRAGELCPAVSSASSGPSPEPHPWALGEVTPMQGRSCKVPRASDGLNPKLVWPGRLGLHQTPCPSPQGLATRAWGVVMPVSPKAKTTLVSTCAPGGGHWVSREDKDSLRLGATHSNLKRVHGHTKLE